jgi:hypothetical protein
VTNPPILPTPIEDVSLAFPADALDYMPTWEEIPDEFKSYTETSIEWHAMAALWFSKGIASDYTGYLPVELEDGTRIEGELIDRQINAILGSYAPKHEHKMAAVAWMLSIWIESAIYGPEGCKFDELRVIGDSIDLEEWREYVDERAEA